MIVLKTATPGPSTCMRSKTHPDPSIWNSPHMTRGPLLHIGMCGSSLQIGTSQPADHPYKSTPLAPDATEARIDAELRLAGILK